MSSSKPQWSTQSWRWIGLIWLGLGLTTATQIVVGMRTVGMRHHWTALFLVWAASWLVWACATPVVLLAGRSFPPVRSTRWKGWFVHFAACLGIGIADASWIGGLQYVWNPLGIIPGPPPFHYLAISSFYERFHVDLITYAAILAVGYTMDSLKRLALREAEAARLSAELSKAQLDALRRQMEPHFLFNTLNGVAGLVRDNQNHAAVEMIAGLSDLLRRVFEGADRQLVPLAEELSFVERYFELQLMRFGDGLSVTTDVPLELYGALVPSLILQPLIENAIQHGIGKRVGGGAIRIGATESGGMLTLAVHNDGPPLPTGGIESSSGVGISNTHGRLRSLYGTACTLEVRNHLVAGVETIVRVPYRTEL
jgi:two-component system, LytTR family, sensor kinase